MKFSFVTIPDDRIKQPIFIAFFHFYDTILTDQRKWFVKKSLLDKPIDKELKILSQYHYKHQAPLDLFPEQSVHSAFSTHDE